jgi:hypothetical protein
VTLGLASLSYQAAVRALDVQERGVEELRGRSGALLAAASLPASFLGAQTIRQTGGVDILAAFALSSLGISVALCVYVLLPKRRLVFSVSAPEVFETLHDLRDDEEEVHRRLIYWLDRCWSENQKTVEDLSRCLLAAATALMLQFAFWTAALTTTMS